LTPIGLPSYAKAQPMTLADKPLTLTIELEKTAPIGELTFALSGVIPKYNYTLNKADIDAATKLKAEAAKAAADLAKLLDDAKKKAAAAPKEQKAEADKVVAEAAEKVKSADAAKKAVDVRADAVIKAGTVKSIINVPVVSTLVTLKITEPAKKETAKK